MYIINIPYFFSVSQRVARCVFMGNGASFIVLAASRVFMIQHATCVIPALCVSCSAFAFRFRVNHLFELHLVIGCGLKRRHLRVESSRRQHGNFSIHVSMNPCRSRPDNPAADHVQPIRQITSRQFGLLFVFMCSNIDARKCVIPKRRAAQGFQSRPPSFPCQYDRHSTCFTSTMLRHVLLLRKVAQCAVTGL